MVPVADELDRHGVLRERRADQPRLAVVQLAHGVEQVRDVRRAGFDAEPRLGCRCVGVADGNGHPALAHRRDERQRAIELGRHRHQSNAVAGKRLQRIELVDRGSAHPLRGLCAGAFRVQVWTFKVNACDARAGLATDK